MDFPPLLAYWIRPFFRVNVEVPVVSQHILGHQGFLGNRRSGQGDFSLSAIIIAPYQTQRHLSFRPHSQNVFEFCSTTPGNCQMLSQMHTVSRPLRLNKPGLAQTCTDLYVYQDGFGLSFDECKMYAWTQHDFLQRWWLQPQTNGTDNSIVTVFQSVAFNFLVQCHGRSSWTSARGDLSVKQRCCVFTAGGSMSDRYAQINGCVMQTSQPPRQVMQTIELVSVEEKICNEKLFIVI